MKLNTAVHPKQKYWEKIQQLKGKFIKWRFIQQGRTKVWGLQAGVSTNRDSNLGFKSLAVTQDIIESQRLTKTVISNANNVEEHRWVVFLLWFWLNQGSIWHNFTDSECAWKGPQIWWTISLVNRFVGLWSWRRPEAETWKPSNNIVSKHFRCCHNLPYWVIN